MAAASTPPALPRQLSARLGAARLVLKDAVGSPTHTAVSALQRDALVDLLGKSDLSSEGRASLGEQVVQLQWAQQDVSAILNAITALGGRSVGVKRRRSAQAYQSILNYLTSEDWEILLERNASDVKLQILLSTAVSLGLRCPSEPCLKLFASVWMCLDKEDSELRRLQCGQKHTAKEHVKREFKRLIYKVADPVEHLETLPESVVHCLRDHRALYLSHFQPPKEPVACKVDVQLIRAFDQTYSCRIWWIASMTPKKKMKMTRCSRKIARTPAMTMKKMQMARCSRKMTLTSKMKSTTTSKHGSCSSAPPTTAKWSEWIEL